MNIIVFGFFLSPESFVNCRKYLWILDLIIANSRTIKKKLTQHGWYPLAPYQSIEHWLVVITDELLNCRLLWFQTTLNTDRIYWFIYYINIISSRWRFPVYFSDHPSSQGELLWSIKSVFCSLVFLFYSKFAAFNVKEIINCGIFSTFPFGFWHIEI